MKKRYLSLFAVILAGAMLLFGCSLPDLDSLYANQRELTEEVSGETYLESEEEKFTTICDENFSSDHQLETTTVEESTLAEPTSIEPTSLETVSTVETTAAKTEPAETSFSETETTTGQPAADVETKAHFDLSMVPAYSGNPYVEINGNIPFFTQSELTEKSFESYSDLDSKGRCGVAFACIGTDIMPTEERGEIGSVRPSGWHTVKYPVIPDRYLYNRCHLIGYQLAGENANVKNLITGTRYLNVQGMLPFENQVADYVKRTNNHVLYRVTPIFEGDNLVANGVLMEAQSIETGEVLFNVFCYNVQPGVVIDYSNGDSYMDESETAKEQEKVTGPTNESSAVSDEDNAQMQYILNTNTKKFHKPECSSVQDMKEKNKKEFFGTRSELIDQGYAPCKRCNP